jgi:hypothetical protein
MKTKRFIFSVIALCCTMVAWAQSNQSVTAILQHVVDGNETVKVYVGKEAFKNAYTDAVNGDVITLSSGSFDVPSAFQKELSVYGAGYEEDAASGTAVTTLNNSINIKDIESLSNLHFEGLRINSTITCNIPISNMVISKCLCEYVYLYGATCTDITIQQCVIKSGVQGKNNSNNITKAENLRIKNCIMGGAQTFDPSSTAQIDHCLLTAKTNPTTQNPYIYPFIYTNCIFGKKGEGVNITGTLQYCIVSWYFSCNNPNNVLDLRTAAVFTDGDWASEYSADRTYTLLKPDEWIGNDNTQIGIHGGMGFSKVPSTPVIKNMTVTPEGKKIKVNYETNVR